MSSFSPLQPWGQVPNAPQSTRLLPRASRRRDKPQLSCSLCRRRKLKCDREHPCQNCVKRGHSCTYAVSSSSSQRLDRGSLPPVAPTNFYGRIEELESLVISAKNSTNPTKSTANQTRTETAHHSKVTQLNKEQGTDGYDGHERINAENLETVDIDNAHWSAILEKIAELNAHFNNDSASAENHAPSTAAPELDAHELWRRLSESSTEAREAVEVLRIALRKAQRLSPETPMAVEGVASSEIDESLLRRPQPFNFNPASRRLRGPMVLPRMDGDRWDDGDLAAALDANAELGDAETGEPEYQRPSWGDILGITKDFQQRFSFPLG